MLVKYVRCTDGPELARLGPQLATLSAAWLLFQAQLALSFVWRLVSCCGLCVCVYTVCVCFLCLVANIRDTSANDIFTLLRKL